MESVPCLPRDVVGLDMEGNFAGGGGRGVRADLAWRRLPDRRVGDVEEGMFLRSHSALRFT